MTDVEEEYKLHKPGDEAANIELVERTEKTSSLNIFVREGARNGHARVLAACLAMAPNRASQWRVIIWRQQKRITDPS